MTKLETYITENEGRFLEDLKGWLRIPSISTLPEHVTDIRRAAEYAVEQLKHIGFERAELIQTTRNGKLPVNVKVLIEGEEEAGGESIEYYVSTYPERLQCDAAFVCDTGMPAKDIPALIYGLRGIIYTEVEVRGAKRDLHSGEFGGVAPNPLHALALIIAKLKDAEGHIQIPSLFDKVRKPAAEELKFWNEDPLHINESLLEEMGVSQFTGEAEYPPMERMWARPTFEVHGITGGFTGEGAKTVIPAVGKAKISLRLG